MGGFSLLVTFIVAASLADVAPTFCDEFCAAHRTFVDRPVCMLHAVLYNVGADELELALDKIVKTGKQNCPAA